MQKTLDMLSILLLGVGIVAHDVRAQEIQAVDLGAQEIPGNPGNPSGRGRRAASRGGSVY